MPSSPLYVSWATMKGFVDSRTLSIQSTVIDNTYRLQAIDSGFAMDCSIYMDGNSDQVDFETNYLPNANQSPVNSVRTQFEQVQYLLQMSNMSSLNIAPGDSAAVTMQIPGTFGGVNPPADGRYIDEGEAWFYPGADGDRVTSIVLSDNDNLLGAGAGYVLGTYHDAQVSANNQGWILHPVFPTEVSTLGWYGFIPAGMYMTITVKRAASASANGNFYCNLKWGMKT